MEKNASGRTHHLRAFVTGGAVSVVLSLLFYSGILITYHYIPLSLLLMAALIIICSLLFFINIRYDHMLDLNEVFSKTISFDMRTGTGFTRFFLRFLRPLNPYVGALTAVMVLLLVLWGVPALIIYLSAGPGSFGTLLKISVFFINMGICISYLFSDRDAFPCVVDRTMFIAGALCGAALIINVI
ncbi:MAG: hypothetical protein AB1499_00125 [Nitrospirota bacterium]